MRVHLRYKSTKVQQKNEFNVDPYLHFLKPSSTFFWGYYLIYPRSRDSGEPGGNKLIIFTIKEKNIDFPLKQSELRGGRGSIRTTPPPPHPDFLLEILTLLAVTSFHKLEISIFWEHNPKVINKT